MPDGVVGHAGVPDVGDAQGADGVQRFVGEIVELAHAVLFDGSPRFIGSVGVAEEAGKGLVDDDLAFCCFWCHFRWGVVELSRYRGKPKITYIPVFHQNNIHHVKKNLNPKPIRLAALHFKRPLTAWPTTLP